MLGELRALKEKKKIMGSGLHEDLVLLLNIQE